MSQSGANSQAIYILLMMKGLGVRHVHATGNLEALKDFRLLLPPFTEEAVIEKLGQLRVAPLPRST